MRRVFRLLALTTIAFAANASATHPASARTMGCGSSIPFSNCSDTGLLAYMCNYTCPNWTFAVCDQEGRLTCYSEPDR